MPGILYGFSAFYYKIWRDYTILIGMRWTFKKL